MTAAAAVLWALGGAATAAAPTPGLQLEPYTATLVVTAAEAVTSATAGRRSPVVTDSVHDRLVRGLSLDELPWRPIEADADGRLGARELAGGYARVTVIAREPRIMLLEARGHDYVYANESPRVGDRYDLGITRIPIAFHAGPNELLFKIGRGGTIAASLTAPPAALFLETRDATLPTANATTTIVHAGIFITNATDAWQPELEVVATTHGGGSRSTTLPTLAPLSSRKAKVELDLGGVDQPTVAVTLTLQQIVRAEPLGPPITIELEGRPEISKRTFTSSIDGSVQYFALRPARPLAPPGRGNAHPEALVVTLHGAGVEAAEHTRRYAPKPWAHIVGPSNRRPYGFDWEDWGRIDALEVIAAAEAELGPTRDLYLTGHSMGGHGTWLLGAQHPATFTAIAPSAGWRDFWSYSGVEVPGAELAPDVARMLDRAANVSRLELVDRNLLGRGVFILHGDRDETVPVREARAMRDRLGELGHDDVIHHEQPEAGHWWGDQCVDWPDLFQFLERRPSTTQPPERVELATVNLAVTSRRHWLRITAQEHSLAPSSAVATWDGADRTLSVTTENVTGARFDLYEFTDRSDGALEVRIDGQLLGGVLWPNPCRPLIVSQGGDRRWRLRRQPLPPWYKGPHRAGPFKEAFRNNMAFVYGTTGSDAESRRLFGKARYDAETFWYRGNGSVDVYPDHAFDPRDDPDRNVILYGNADTNALWTVMSPNRAIEVRRGSVRIGDTYLEGDDLACLFLYPRAGSDHASIGFVGGTGLKGFRLTEQLPYFVSGVHYPDWTLLRADMLERGIGGVVGAGFFRNDWSPLGSDAAWNLEKVP